MLPNFHWILFGNLFLCFNAGYIDSLTFNSLYMIPSSHMSGNLAQIGIQMAYQKYAMVFYILMTYLSFICGCIITGIVIKDENFKLGQNYGILLLFISMILIFGIIIEDWMPNSIYFIICCSFVCGLQNAMTSKYSNNIIRTTHMTGSTTDIGIYIGHYINGNKEDIWKLKTLTISVFGFLIGSFIGTIAYQHFIHFALIFNIFISFICGIIHLTYCKLNLIDS
jgi:uncharacterized membrane protein YoaK (UPF0700 family)